MRMLKSYELKEGENKMTVPISAEVVCTANWGEKFGVVFEVETEEKEFGDRAFLLVGEGEEIKEGMVLNYVGIVYPPIEGKFLVVFEIL